jgi:hypothetical protein
LEGKEGAMMRRQVHNGVKWDGKDEGWGKEKEWGRKRK